MTVTGKDGGAGAGPERDERGERGAGAASDAGDALDELDALEDPALRSMRAVWISMREEDPPAAGLSALLAAARSQAEAMRPREPWWQRVLASLRRPPVFAFATVTVLLGGAVVLSSRREAFEATPAVEAPGGRFAAEPAPGPDPAAPPEQAQAEEAKDRGGLSASAGAPAGAGASGTATATGAGASGAATATATESEGQRGPSASGKPDSVTRPQMSQPSAADPKPSRRVVGSSRTISGGGPGAGGGPAEKEPAATGGKAKLGFDDFGATAPESASATPPPPAPAEIPVQATAPQPVRQAPKGTVAAPRPKLEIAGEGAGAGNAPAADTAADTDARVTGSAADRSTTARQLVKQAEAAAVRGDCAAVRTLVAQIRKLSPTYPGPTEQSTAVKRCLK